MPGTMSEQAREAMRQELALRPEQFDPPEQPTSKKGAFNISPGLLHTIGGLADAASTYTFMKRGNGVETNPMVTAVAGSNPEMTGLAALGGLGITKAITHLLGKKYPRIADAIAANLGAEQAALSVANFNGYENANTPSAFDQYQNAMVRSTTRGK